MVLGKMMIKFIRRLFVTPEPKNEILTRTGYGVKSISYQAVRKNIRKIISLAGKE